MAFDQKNFRIRSDDTQGLNTDAGWAAALNTNATISAESRFRIRFEVEETAGATDSRQFKLQYRRNGGTWTDVPVRNVAENVQTGTDRVEINLSDQYADNDATTNLLSGSSATFEAGHGLEDNLTNSITLTNEHTEYEWALRFRKVFHNGTNKGANADGDTFEFRIVESSGTVFAAYSQTPSITLDTDHRIGGTMFENVGRCGPFRDGNGFLYVAVEYGEPNNSDEIVMMKSTDGGVQWMPVDEAGAPTSSTNGADDFESVDIQQVGTVLHIAHFNGANRVRYSTFNTSDAGSNPDTWQIKSEVVADPSPSPSDQDAAIAVRSDGTVVIIYRTSESGTDERLGYKIRSAGGSWGSENILDSTAGGDFRGGRCVVGASDKTYIFYVDGSTSLAYYKTLDSANSLSSRTQLNPTGTVPNAKPFTQALYIDDGGTEHISVTYRRSNLVREISIRGGVLQSERTASDNNVGNNLAGTTAPHNVHAVDVPNKKFYLAYVTATSPNDILYWDRATLTGSYGTDAVAYDSPQTTAPALAEITGSYSNATLHVIVSECKFGAGFSGGPIYKSVTGEAPPGGATTKMYIVITPVT